MAEIVKAGRLLAMALVLVLLGAMACARAAEPTPTPKPVAAPLATPTPAVTPTPAIVRLTEWTVILSEDTAEGDPYTEYGTNVPGYVGGHVMEALVWKANPKGTIITFAPFLAESFEIPDDKTLVFRLKKGIKFHNGEELTAENVKLAHEGLLAIAKTSRRGSNQPLLGELQVVDNYTVKFSMPRVYAPALELVERMLLAPSVRKQMSGAEFGKKPIGTGPYKVLQWERDKPIILENIDGYWRGKKAFPPRLVFRYVPEPSTRVAEVLAGRAQIAQRVPIGELSRLETNPKTEVAALKGFGELNYVINLYVTNPPLSDKRVRLALNLAVDKETLVKSILEGRGAPDPAGVLMRNELGWKDDFKPYPYDPAKAKELLKESGVPDGFSFDWIITQGVFQKDFEIAEAAANQMAKVGIKAKLVPLERARLLQNRKDGTYHVLELVWYFVWDRGGPMRTYFILGHPDDNLIPKWGPTPQVLVKIRGMIEEGESTLDLEKRRVIYERLNSFAIDEAVQLNIHNVDELWGVQKGVGWRPPAIGSYAAGGDTYYDTWGMEGKTPPK